MPITDPTTSRIRIAPIAVEMPRLIPASRSLPAVTVQEANDDGDTGAQDERDLIWSPRRLVAEQGDRQDEHPDQHRHGDQGLSDAGIANGDLRCSRS